MSVSWEDPATARAWRESLDENHPVTPSQPILDVLPRTPAGERAAWVWERLLAVAGGAPVPTQSELEDQYTQDWLDEVQMPEVYAWMAPLTQGMTEVHEEPAPANEVRFVVARADGTA